MINVSYNEVWSKKVVNNNVVDDDDDDVVKLMYDKPYCILRLLDVYLKTHK